MKHQADDDDDRVMFGLHRTPSMTMTKTFKNPKVYGDKGNVERSSTVNDRDWAHMTQKKVHIKIVIFVVPATSPERFKDGVAP
ncbi:hypothetical protein An08g07720 [Aspergillus niger]|uniref:Uncharacterized protein n=2 Tax=Aspergillus niger TaxID=5061 RepID=A2QRZ3_ASPNC|nr:hypothetical protein An08g07720 [Aspergillus niger]CAL00790.1 hypothetical protein An08g07720 [Aspergillus niger]